MKQALGISFSHPLQSPEWAEFRKKWGNEVVKTKFGYITLHKIPFTTYKIGMFIKGPTPSQEMFDELKKLAKEQNLVFIKLEPNVVVNSKFKDQKSKLQLKSKNELIRLLRKNNCQPGKTLFTPTTFWIDLTPSEEDLLKSFSSKTRYNIRLAQKREVKVKVDNSKKTFKKYLELTRETVERQGFYAHTEKYHRLMWQYLHLQPTTHDFQPIARLLTARYKGEIITTWILFVYKNFLYYPYGASSSNPKFKPLMANNLVMWEAIMFGKKLGCTTFDLWGREPGKGFTKFKEGYNPKVIEFLGTWDYVVNKPIYEIYKVAEKIRWTILRGKTKLGLSKSKF